MSVKQKLIERFKTKPKNFTWKETITLCQSLGFSEIQGSGSRVKFFHERLDFVICIHRPHPSTIVKEYVLRQLLDTLERKELI